MVNKFKFHHLLYYIFFQPIFIIEFIQNKFIECLHSFRHVTAIYPHYETTGAATGMAATPEIQY